VNVVGWWWKGRPQIETKVAESHLFMFREGTVTNNEIHFRFLTSEIAVVHVGWSMVGNRNPDGTPGLPRRGSQTHVLRNQAGKWWIVALNNVDGVPEVTFPGATEEMIRCRGHLGTLLGLRLFCPLRQNANGDQEL